ncbi:MAG: DUF1206 domain-containing protein [Actinomycetota bacterium]|nr:DUF1206 domain-containing protein [Actinomycetota bacterium]
MNANQTAAEGERLARKADDSNLLDHAVRVGLVSYGIVHLLIAWLAVQLAIGSSAGSASSKGALSELAQKPGGQILLFVVAAGFLALVLWQLVETLVGHRSDAGAKRVAKHVGSAGKVVLYASLGYSALKIAVGSGSSGGGTDTMTAELMAVPGGQVLVAVVGAGVLGVAGFLIWRGLTERFKEDLRSDGHTGNTGKAYCMFGKVGYTSKGLALIVVGGLFVWAAWSHDPEKSGGLDQALGKVLQQPFGAPVLVVIALGIAGYGLFCFAWARHLDR